MTEIDTTPAAYARFLANQHRVDSWARDATAHAAEYQHPFESHQPHRRPQEFGPVPEVRPSDSISLYEPPDRRRARENARSRDESRRRDEERQSREHSRSREIVVERPRRARAMTAPGPQALQRPVLPPPQPMYYMQPPPQGTLQRSHSQSRQPQQPQLVRTSSRSAPHSRPRSPPPRVHATMQATTYRTVDLRAHPVQPGHDIQLPPAKPGESYMIIPPKGRRVEVIVRPVSCSRISHADSSPQSASPSAPYTFRTTPIQAASAPTSPTYHPGSGGVPSYPVSPRSHPSSKTKSRSPTRYGSGGGGAPMPPPAHYFLPHTPVQPSPLHVSGPAQHVYAYGVPQVHPGGGGGAGGDGKKKGAPLLKRLLTSHVTWGEKPPAGRRLSN
jgi:hypothetical protein